MKLFVSTDMEGVGGLASWSEMDSPARTARCYELLAREVSWVIDELEATAAPGTIEEVCVCDSHARGEGLPYGCFGKAFVTQVRGYPRPFYMMEGLDSSFDAVLLVGYHARIGSLRGMMDHSYSASAIHSLRLNGVESGEVEINAYLAGRHGVPVGLVSGDDALEAQLPGLYPEGIPYVRTKEGLGRFAGKMYPPEALEPSFRRSTREMLSRLGKLEPKRPAAETVLEVEIATTTMADAVAIVPGIRRTGGRMVEYASREYMDIYRMINVIAMLGGKFSQYT
jgi:D-amino peptidase